MYYIATDNGTVHTLPFLRPSHGTVTATVRRERGPEGWLQGSKVTDDDDDSMAALYTLPPSFLPSFLPSLL